MMEKCIFCKIARGEIPHNKIWENSSSMAFLDLNPINTGHTIVIPKEHSSYLFDLNDKEYEELMLSAKKVAKLLKEKLNPKRIGVIVEGFEIPHVHIHLVPINKGSELNPNNSKHANLKELKKVADKIRG